MSYKIKYQGNEYAVDYSKEILLTEGNKIIVNHIIRHDKKIIVDGKVRETMRLCVTGKTLEEVVKKFCEVIEKEK